MKIGLDISQSVYKGSGVGRFTDGLSRAICSFGQKHEWVFFFSSLRQKLDPRLKQTILKKNHTLIEKSYPPTLLSFLWNTLHVYPIENLIGPLDWFITSDWTEPPSKCKKAAVVHDLVFARYPKTVDSSIKKTQIKRLKHVENESTVIFADSSATKNDLEELMGIEQLKIFVNYPGIDFVNVSQNVKEQVKKKYRLNRPFILAVGKLEPRKNIDNLVEAFAQLAENNIELIIVGMHGWGKTIRSKKNVRFLGFVSDHDLYALYELCLFFIYPSLWEGFGYPVVEAMSHGAAVTTSDTSSLAEIGGDSALLFNPFEVKDIKCALEQLIKDDRLRNDLAKKGHRKSLLFTWRRYYETMIKVLENYS